MKRIRRSYSIVSSLARQATCGVLLLAIILTMLASSVHAQVPGLEDIMGIPKQAEKPEEPAETSTEPKTPPKPNARYDSPRKTVYTFLDAMENNLGGNAQTWSKATGAMDFSSLPDMTESQQRRLAEILYAILMQIEKPFPYEDLDDKTLVSKNSVEEQRYFPNDMNLRQQVVLRRLGEKPRGAIVLKKVQDGTWKFSDTTVEELNPLWEQFRVKLDLDGEILVTRSDHVEWYLINAMQLPRSVVQSHLLGIEYWKWAGMLLVIMIGLILDQSIRMLLRIMVARNLRRRGLEFQIEEVKKSVRPFGLLVAAVLWLLTLKVINLEGIAVLVVQGALQVFIVLAGLLSIWRLVDLFASYLSTKATLTSTRLDDVLVPLIRKSLKIFAGLMGVIYGADALDIPIGPLLASVGVGAVAFSFAAKDTVENFFGSLAVLFDRPFDIGDWVVVNDVEGTVEEVGFRSTRIRTFYNSQITMPNSNLVRAVVDNYGRRKYRRWKENIGVQYDTTPDQLISFTEGIRELVRNHPYTRKDYFQVRLNTFGDSSYNILVYTFVQVDDWSMELRERERLMLDIIRLADQLGVQFAFPTRTVHLFTEQHEDYQTQHEPPQRNTDRRAEVAGIRAAQKLVQNQRWQTEPPGPVPFPEGPVHLDEDGHIDPADITPDTKPQDVVSEAEEKEISEAQQERQQSDPDPSQVKKQGHDEPPSEPGDDASGTIKRS